ncbi:MAG: nuclear transport factor 2 family protein [Pseudomonadota bacterium]
MRAILCLLLCVSLWPGKAVSKDDEYTVLNAYFSVFETKSANDLPLSEDATFYGALLPEPIVGREAIIAFLNRVAPSVELKEVKQAFEGESGACAELVFTFSGAGVTLEEAHCLKIDEGQIVSIRLYYDPRPLLEASGS